MFRLASLAGALLLLALSDFPRVYVLRPQPMATLDASFSGFSSAPNLFLAAAQTSKAKLDTPEVKAQLAIIRYVDGEYAHAIKPLPSEKHGFHYIVGKPIDPKELRNALAHGSAANPGDQVQITNIEFRDKVIIVSINGGTKKHFNLAQHLQISATGVPMTTVTPVRTVQNRIGAELVLDYGKRVPQLTPDQLKQDLAPFLDFGGEHSSAVNWIETLPPQIQEAIKNHTAVVGMSHDMVIAALGRPDQKVREYDEDGHETEDWVYGHPPEKTVLVTFQGDKVIRVKSYG
jgi:hypothetical protein